MKTNHVPTISCCYSDHRSIGVFNASLEDSEAHFEYEMILVDQGEVAAQIGASDYHLKRGSLVFISRMEYHRFQIIKDPYVRFVASISPEQLLSGRIDSSLSAILVQRPVGFIHVIQLEPAEYRNVYTYFRDLATEYKNEQPLYESKMTSLFHLLLIELFRTHPKAFLANSNHRMSHIVSEIQRRIMEHPEDKLSLEDLAGQFFISRHTLSVAFHEITGITFKEYLILYRLTEAKKMLSTTDLSIEEVAARVGYLNVNNFIRIFQSKESLTPLKYRQRIRSLRANGS